MTTKKEYNLDDLFFIESKDPELALRIKKEIEGINDLDEIEKIVRRATKKVTYKIHLQNQQQKQKSKKTPFYKLIDPLSYLGIMFLGFGSYNAYMLHNTKYETKQNLHNYTISISENNFQKKSNTDLLTTLIEAKDYITKTEVLESIDSHIKDIKYKIEENNINHQKYTELINQENEMKKILEKNYTNKTIYSSILGIILMYLPSFTNRKKSEKKNKA
jgi:hypothetical protein